MAYIDHENSIMSLRAMACSISVCTAESGNYMISMCYPPILIIRASVSDIKRRVDGVHSQN